MKSMGVLPLTSAGPSFLPWCTWYIFPDI